MEQEPAKKLLDDIAQIGAAVAFFAHVAGDDRAVAGDLESAENQIRQAASIFVDQMKLPKPDEALNGVFQENKNLLDGEQHQAMRQGAGDPKKLHSAFAARISPQLMKELIKQIADAPGTDEDGYTAARRLLCEAGDRIQTAFPKKFQEFIPDEKARQQWNSSHLREARELVDTTNPLRSGQTESEADLREQISLLTDAVTALANQVKSLDERLREEGTGRQEKPPSPGRNGRPPAGLRRPDARRIAGSPRKGS